MKAKIRHLSFAEYRDLDAVNATLLKHLVVSPKLALYRMTHDKDTDPMLVGRGIHTKTFEPRKYKSEYRVYEGAKRAGKDYEAFVQKYRKCDVITTKMDETICSVATAIRADDVAGPLVKAPGKVELTIVWEHPRTGLFIKVRIDKLLVDALLELKTTKALDSFSRTFSSLYYHLQLALYSDAVAAAGRGILPVKCIAAETDEPNDVAVYDIPEDTVLCYGRDLYENALDLYKHCKEQNHWPGVANGRELEMSLLPWARPEPELEGVAA